MQHDPALQRDDAGGDLDQAQAQRAGRRALLDEAEHLLPHQRPEPAHFERTLFIAEEGSHVSYLEGCTAPMRDENQLHAAVVELIAYDDATIKYSTVQNWYPGDAERRAASTTS